MIVARRFEADGMRRLAFSGLIIAGLSSLLAGCVAGPIERSEPLRARNQHPAQLTAIHAQPRAVRATEVGRVDVGAQLDWTSLWLRPGRGADAFTADGEIARMQIDARVGIVPDVDLEIGVPLLHASGGMLDSFIEGWHDVFGLPQADRDDFPRDQYRVEATRGGALAYQLEEDGVRFGDVPVFLSWFPVTADGEGVSFGIRGGVEIPTGSERNGTGNGGYDYNVSLLGAYDGDGFSLFGWGGHSWIARPDTARDAGLPVPDVDSAGVGLQVAVTRDLTGLAQVEYETSVLRELDDAHADQAQVQLWLGGRYRLGKRASIEAAVGEDLVSDVSPDVTFHLGIRFGL